MTFTASGPSLASTLGGTLCRIMMFDSKVYYLLFLDAPEGFVTTIGIVKERKNVLKIDAKAKT